MKENEKKIFELIKQNQMISNSEISNLTGISEKEVEEVIRNSSDSRLKILIVDDEMDMLLPLKKSLESENYVVVVAYDGKEAIEKAKTELPDLILLDLMLPEMDGYEVCDLLRKESNTKNIPIIMLTAKDSVREKVKGLETGADDFVTKPFNLKELKARISSLLRRSKNM